MLHSELDFAYTTAEGKDTTVLLQRNTQRRAMTALPVVKGRPRRGSPLMTTPLADVAGQEGLWLRTITAWGATCLVSVSP